MPAPASTPSPVDEPVVEDFFVGAAKPASSASSSSLQENFRKFRQQKLAEAREKKKQGVDKKKTRPQAEKDALRAKWVAQLKKYLGVPYAKRYYPAEDYPEDYERGDFLDCCGILRQASADLEGEWGWKLGRWNQTYQFALSPKGFPAANSMNDNYDIASEQELKPGDLIFYEAEYHDQWRKPQHWNITHIEVYLGPEKQTIGSRWKQRVSLHETYELGTDEFPSQLWTVKKFHFRISTYHLVPPNDWWLESYTLPAFVIPEAYDKFPVMPPPSNHKSIFFLNQDAAEEDAVEGGEEDEMSGMVAEKS
eukprot:g14819.t1